MNTRTAVSLIAISSLALLLSGCGAGQAGRDAAAVGLARGNVIVKDDFSLAEQPFSGEVWRELKADAPQVAEQPFSADVRRELKADAPQVAEQPFSADVWRELKADTPKIAEQPFSADVWRELKGGFSEAPGTAGGG
jgi:hypothetical protein